MKLTPLATITLDNSAQSTGELYYRDGDIYCCDTATGETWATQTGATAETAAQVISDAWGRNWNLEWIDAA
jgi:uncharacterized Zn ribbon protein